MSVGEREDAPATFASSDDELACLSKPLMMFMIHSICGLIPVGPMMASFYLTLAETLGVKVIMLIYLP